MKDSTMYIWQIVGILMFIVGLCVIAISAPGLLPSDSTDLDRHNRSGLRLHVDNLHGCHYLSTFLGGPTPRLDADGNHICTGWEQPE